MGAPMATEVGVAYVRILPTTKGLSAAIRKELDGALGKAGQSGNAAGAAIVDGIDSGIDGKSGKLRGAADKVGGIFKAGLAAAGVAGAAVLTAGLSQALDAEAATDKLTAQLGGTQWAADAAGIAGNLYKEAFGDSMADTADAVKQVIQSGVVDQAQLADLDFVEGLTRQALTFSDVLDQDLNMSLQAVDRMLASGLAGSADEAFDILTTGIQQGVDSSGDLTETFQEYSTIFRDIGLSGAEATGLLSQGLKAGARDADVVADSLKEFAIRAQDGSAASAEGFELIGLNAAEMTAAVAQGGPAARDALGQVLQGLQAMEDPAERNAAAVALFGTKAEDLGDALFALDLEQAGMLMRGHEGRTDQLASAYDNARRNIESFKRKALDKIITVVGNTVIPLFERFADAVGPTLSAAFEGIKSVLGAIDFGALLAPLQEFWYTLTSGFTEDEGTGIELLALKIRNAVIELIPKLQEFAGFITGTVVPVVIAGVGAMADLWAEHSDQVLDILGQLGSLIGDTFSLVVEVVETATSIAMALWSAFGDDIVSTAGVAMGLILDAIQAGLDIVQGIVRTATAILQGDWSGALDGMRQALGGFIGLATTALRAGFESLKLIVKVGWALIKATFVRAGTEIVGWVRRNIIDRVVGFFRGLPGSIGRAMSSLADTITSPFRSGFRSIRNWWNDTVGGWGFSVPDWVPGVGGRGWNIPRMHTGGIVPGAGDVPIVARAGEGVFTRTQMAAMAPVSAMGAGGTVVQLVADGESRYVEWLRHTIRVNGGGDVQTALGS